MEQQFLERYTCCCFAPPVPTTVEYFPDDETSVLASSCWGGGGDVFSTFPIDPMQDFIIPVNCQGPVRHDFDFARRISAHGLPTSLLNYDKVLQKN